ncbi:MAG: hypothetical protein ACTHQM_14990 [Thermoanaerobaculia bacterium]
MKTMILLIVVALATAQWLMIAIMALFTDERFPKKGMRQADRTLIVSSVILALAWMAQVDYSMLWKGDARATTASTVAVSRGSCATLDTGMTVDQVKKRMGYPDRMTPDEETRGPGAVTLHYDGSRCSVHVFDGKVEFVD